MRTVKIDIVLSKEDDGYFYAQAAEDSVDDHDAPVTKVNFSRKMNGAIAHALEELAAEYRKAARDE